MPLFHRIVQAHWAPTAMDGEGARRFGGRWNLPGESAVYLAESRALATLEILVHAPREALLLDWVIIGVQVPETWIAKVEVTDLPTEWQARPTSWKAQVFGSRWLREGRKPALRLPSVVIPEESSLLLNPKHAKTCEMKVGEPRPFRFDSRLASSV